MSTNSLLHRDSGRSFLVFAALAACSSPALVESAAAQDCSTIVPPRQFEWERARLAMRGEQTRGGGLDPDAPWYVPLYVHIVRTAAGSGGLSLDDLELSLRQANSLLSDYGVRVFHFGEIDYIDDDDFAYLDGCGEDELLRQTNNLPEVINLYYVPDFAEVRCIPFDGDEIGECCAGGGVECPEGWFCALDADHKCGRSTFSQTDNTPGIIVCNEGATNGSTLAHEIGHFFDLYHTHSTGFGVECPDGSNCDLAGDLVCDTDADPNLSGHTEDCAYDDYADPPDECDDTPYAPDPANVMSYAPKECRSIFSSGQMTRFYESWVLNRTDLFGRTGYVATGLGSEQDGTPLLPFDEIGEAVEAAQAGDHLFIWSGDYPEDLLITTPVTLHRWNTTESVVIGSN